MTVFKGYMMMTKKKIGQVLMYFGIFLCVAILMNVAFLEEKGKGFAAKKLDIAVVDLDQSDLSKQLVTYLKKKHHITVERDDKAKLSEELYYQGQNVVLRIQKNLLEKVKSGKSGIYLTNSPGSYSGIYLEQQINNFVRNVNMYHTAGYSIEEGCQKVLQQKESTVTIEDLNGNGGEMPAHGVFFQYLPYLFIASLGVVLGQILYIFRKREVKNRLMASSVPLARQNVETILAFITIGTIMYFICMIFMLLLYSKSALAAKNIGWYVGNGFLNMLAALEIAFIIGLLVKKERQVDVIMTPFSLGLSFLGGVFVPLNVMGAQVKAVAKFLPVYWYETVNNLLMDYEEITGTVREQVLMGIGIQVLFLLALAGIGLAIVQYQQQER